VVHDDAAALKLLDTALRQLGFRPTCTDLPDIALAAAADYAPDLVILDLLMARLPGAAFLDRFRAIPTCQRVPVIVWTVKDMLPFEREHLLAQASAIVSRRDGGIAALLDEISRFVVPPDAPREGQRS
jgi:CheY-like chemotaxis protein